MILIGIDTGVDTGVAIWDTISRRFLSIETLKIHQAMDVVRAFNTAPGAVGVRFEDARQRRYIPYAKDERGERGRAQGAGYVKAHGQIWEDFLRDSHIPYNAVAPKDNDTKLRAEAFRLRTGWQGRTNEHERDAGMLVFGLDKIYVYEQLEDRKKQNGGRGRKIPLVRPKQRKD